MMAAWIRLCLAGLLFVVLLPPRAATTHDSPLLDALEEAAGDFLAVYEGIARGSPCSSERLQESCLDEDFVFFGNAQLATVPVSLRPNFKESTIHGRLGFQLLIIVK